MADTKSQDADIEIMVQNFKDSLLLAKEIRGLGLEGGLGVVNVTAQSHQSTFHEPVDSPPPICQIRLGYSPKGYALTTSSSPYDRWLVNKEVPFETGEDVLKAIVLYLTEAQTVKEKRSLD